jgi:hypothetical protein
MSEADYTRRYEGIRARPEEVAKIIAEDRALIGKFEATIGALDPGVILHVGVASIALDDAGWNWLRPLLQELAEYRKMVDELRNLTNESAST